MLSRHVIYFGKDNQLVSWVRLKQYAAEKLTNQVLYKLFVYLHNVLTEPEVKILIVTQVPHNYVPV